MNDSRNPLPPQGEALDELLVGPQPPTSTRWPEPVMNFLIAYDIADPKRLRAVAKYFESCGRRVQKSVFLFTGSRKELDAHVASAVQYIEPSEDRIQAWPIRTSTRACRVDAGTGLPETAVALVLTDEHATLIEAVDDDGSQGVDDEAYYLD